MNKKNKDHINMNVKVSVIIPVYRVEKYLDRCVKSIVNQTYRNLEIILVDDGSPDNCPQICDEWSSRDERIRTVHRDNGGLSCARNTGLSTATGDYVTFVDSDDWIALDTYEYCMFLLERNEGANAIQFDVMLTSDETAMPAQVEEQVEVYEGKKILEYYMDSSTRKSGGFSVCRCLFEASTAKRYSFREGKINEDMDYKFKVLRDCKKWVVSNRVKYFYWQDGNSTSSGKLKTRDFQLYEAADELYKLCQQESYGKIAYLGEVKKARTPFSLLSRIAMWGVADSNINEKDITKKLTKGHRKKLSILLKAPIPFSRKVLSIMFAINFPMTKWLLSVTRKVNA